MNSILLPSWVSVNPLEGLRAPEVPSFYSVVPTLKGKPLPKELVLP